MSMCDYLVAVVDGDQPQYLHPFHNGIPFYIGYGELVPEDRFVMDGCEYKVEKVFAANHPQNPFAKPVVMAHRVQD